jgi:hypothetical protein
MSYPVERPPHTPPPPRRGSSPWPWVILIVVLTPLLAGLIFVIVTLGGLAQAWQSAHNLLSGKLVMRTEQPAVVLQVQQLNRLETASFTIEKVIEGGVDEGNPILNALLGDRVLFIAHGDVIAGVDLSQLQPADVTLQDNQNVTLRLPAAHILTHRLDNSLSRVSDRQHGLFAPADTNLETQVRQVAEDQIVQAACQGGILDQANANAQTQVRALLVTMGFNQVTFLPPAAAGNTGCDLSGG